MPVSCVTYNRGRNCTSPPHTGSGKNTWVPLVMAFNSTTDIAQDGGAPAVPSSSPERRLTSSFGPPATTPKESPLLAARDTLAGESSMRDIRYQRQDIVTILFNKLLLAECGRPPDPGRPRDTLAAIAEHIPFIDDDIPEESELPSTAEWSADPEDPAAAGVSGFQKLVIEQSGKFVSQMTEGRQATWFEPLIKKDSWYDIVSQEHIVTSLALPQTSDLDQEGEAAPLCTAFRILSPESGCCTHLVFFLPGGRVCISKSNASEAVWIDPSKPGTPVIDLPPPRLDFTDPIQLSDFVTQLQKLSGPPDQTSSRLPVRSASSATGRRARKGKRFWSLRSEDSLVGLARTATLRLIGREASVKKMSRSAPTLHKEWASSDLNSSPEPSAPPPRAWEAEAPPTPRAPSRPKKKATDSTPSLGASPGGQPEAQVKHRPTSRVRSRDAETRKSRGTSWHCLRGSSPAPSGAYSYGDAPVVNESRGGGRAGAEGGPQEKPRPLTIGEDIRYSRPCRRRFRERFSAAASFVSVVA